MTTMPGTLDWLEVAQRLAAAHYWWVATSGPAGPHAVPVWGVVVDGVPWWYGEPDGVRARNLAADRRCVVHLESAEDVLIVRGTAARAGPPGEQPDVVAAYRVKYTAPDEQPFLPDDLAMAGAVLYRVTPTAALTWEVSDFLHSERRWRAPKC